MDMTPHEYANLWYLKFEHSWIPKTKLDEDWVAISKTLMKNSLVDYCLLNVTDRENPVEAYKLKEQTCR